MTDEQDKLQKFLKAIDAVKQDYTCGQCLGILKDPLTLSVCFHMVCAAHLATLTNCPTCKIPLSNCKTFKYDEIESVVTSAWELDKLFKSIRKNSENQSETFTPPETADKENIQRRSNLKVYSRKLQSDHNTSVLSTASSTTNKGQVKKNKKGETPLHIACRLGKVDTVLELLNQGVNTNTKDNAGWTPLHEVVQNGRLDLLKLLLQHNTLIDVPGQGNETPLHEAIRYNHKDIAIELVQNGANVNARNCKGETPIELASKEMKQALKKAEENIIQTQGVNITLSSELHVELDFEEIVVHCVSKFKTVYNKLKKLTKYHSNLKIEPNFTKKVTHLVIDTDDKDICMSTLEVLQGIVNSIWIVSANWINKSTEFKLQHFKDYEVLGVGTFIYNGPRNSRFNKYKQLPGIFNGCHFYFHNFNSKYEVSPDIILTKPIISKLVTDAGGVVLRRTPNPELIPESEQLVPYHASEKSKLFKCSHYIIYKDMYEPLYNMPHLKALPIGWLIECIEKYELCEPW